MGCRWTKIHNHEPEPRPAGGCTDLLQLFPTPGCCSPEAAVSGTGVPSLATFFIVQNSTAMKSGSWCGPQNGGEQCSVQGECCSAVGQCGKGQRFCKDGLAMYNASPKVTCDKPKSRREPACATASKPTTEVGQPRCGPMRNAMCPWRQGEDLCCVQAPGQTPGEGMCMRCSNLSREERARMLLWSPGMNKKQGGWI